MTDRQDRRGARPGAASPNGHRDVESLIDDVADLLERRAADEGRRSPVRAERVVNGPADRSMEI